MNYWHNYPFVRIVISFILGIILTVNWDVFIPSWIFIVLLFLCFSLTYFARFRIYKLRNLYGLFMFLLFVILGNNLADSKLSEPIIPTKQNIKSITAFIIEPPDETEKCIKLIVQTNVISTTDSCVKQSSKALLYLQKDSLSKALQLGEEILIFSGFDTIKPPMNPYAFNFKRYLKFKQIFYQAYIRSDQWMLVSEGKGNKIKLWTDGIRNHLIGTLKKHEYETEYLGVASAILLGYDQILDPETRDEFADAGAMHVLCVSGLHVGIIYLIFASLFSFLKKYKKGELIRGVLLLLVIWVYAFITGLSPSVLRASCMLSFIIIGKSLSRKSSIYNSLAASAFLLLLINPLMLMEVGFQLSYSAVLGIVSVFPILRKRLYSQNKILQKIRDILIVSFAAQLGTFPLAIYYFHQFPIYFLLTNLLVVSFVGIIIYVGFAFFAFSAVPYLNLIISFVLKKCIAFLCFYVEFVESLPFASLEDLVLSIPAIILLFVLMLAVFRSILKRSKKWFFLGSISVYLLLVLFSFRNYKNISTHKIVAYDVANGLAIDFISSGKNTLLLDNNLKGEGKSISFAAGNHWIYSGIKEPNIQTANTELIQSLNFVKYKSVVSFRGKKILLLDGKITNQALLKKTKLDIVFISSNPKVKLKVLDSLYHPKQIIINSNNSYYFQKKWKKEAIESNIPIWLIAKSGAFIKKIE